MEISYFFFGMTERKRAFDECEREKEAKKRKRHNLLCKLSANKIDYNSFVVLFALNSALDAIVNSNDTEREEENLK